MEKRLCPECGEPIVGRIDKKFCSDLCRNSFNNKANSDSTNYVRNTNNILRKNRRILEELLKGEKLTLPRQRLIDRGFNFKYFTSIFHTRNNHTYYYCYEYGYLPVDNDLILIVKKKAV
ncbi:MAG TPA: hypothetical protein PLQ93_00900 [Bacteroidia bacterium]|nr:hypothetical protein [Bacteroidia bacterium]